MSSSIITLLNDSLKSFRQTRARSNLRQTPNPRSRDNSFSKQNTSSASERPSLFQPRPPAEQPIQISKVNTFPKPDLHDSFTNILDSDSFIDCKSPGNAVPASKDAEELESLFQEINHLKQDQKSLESQVQVLELKVHENLKSLHRPLKQPELKDIVERISSLQSKFSNRDKSPLIPNKLSDLFEKLSKLEADAESIKKENTEVENLYHESLNEIYRKIDKLKKENKALTDVILANSSYSPDQSRKFQNSFEGFEGFKDLEGLDSLDGLNRKVVQTVGLGPELNSEEVQELESQRLRIEQELRGIPASSKSLASKKMRQALERDLQEVRGRLAALDSR